MAISGYNYAVDYSVVDIYGFQHFAVQDYKSNGSVKFRFYDYKLIELDENLEFNGDVVFYNNGTKCHLTLKHVSEAVGGSYKHGYTGTLSLRDANDNVIPNCSFNISDDDIVRAPYNVFPLLNTLYFFYGGIQYLYTLNTDTVVGDPAVSLRPFAHIFYKLDNLCPDYSGVVDLSDIQGHGGYLSLTPNFLNDTNLNNVKSAVIAAGDGKDPFGSGEPSDDPDASGPGGGDKPSPDGGEPVDFPGIPTTNALGSGLLTAYNPDNSLLRQFAGVLWGNDFEQSIKKILNDPFDGIVGLSLLPFAPHTSGSVSCEVGNFDTEITMPVIDQQYMVLDCGSININESWHNALDYSPATDCSIFLPFVGFKALTVEDVMNNKISVKYNVDILSGAGIAFVKCGDKVMYTYPCKLSFDIPLTGSNKAALYTGMIGVAMSAIGGAAKGGALGAVGGAATSAIQTATSKQSDVERSGAITSNTGVLGDFTPYVLLHRPVQSMPKDFKKIKGYQSNITAQLSSITGYTEIDYIHLTGISGATDSELNEIERLLKEGVII